jgi:HK97 family phage prohead protease
VSAHDIIYKSASAEPPQRLGKRSIVVKASTQDIDRDGDILVTAGIDFSAYLKNPVVLFSHQMLALPVGKTTRLWRSADKMALLAEIEFAPTAAGDDMLMLYTKGFMSACSVGFRIIAAGAPSSTNIYSLPSGERDKLRRIIQLSELLELSLVSIPANAHALLVNVEEKSFKSTLIRDVVYPREPLMKKSRTKSPVTLEEAERSLKIVRQFEAKVASAVRDGLPLWSEKS